MFKHVINTDNRTELTNYEYLQIQTYTFNVVLYSELLMCFFYVELVLFQLCSFRQHVSM
jgi:hypothetical protein